ncbi:MAG: hypothetical protein NE330_20835, partial [Lentisphaeraceae bacterium]|nr:hypothetical protein [Lentisphaeraceae bacterium]
MYSLNNDNIIAGRYHLHGHVSSDIFSDMYEATDMLRKAPVQLRFFNEVWMNHVSSSEDLIETKDSISEMLQPYHLKIKDWKIGNEHI